MRMAKMSLERIKAFDKVWGREVEEFLRRGANYGHPTPFFLSEEHEDYPLIARKWGVSVQEFLTYAHVREYINLSAHGACEHLPSPWQLAEDLGIPAEVFNNYLHEEIRMIREAYRDAS